MAETLLSVRTEVEAAGLSRLGDTVVNRLINDAYAWVVKQQLWPWREATATGAAPLTISDIGSIASVIDTANGNKRLGWRDRRTIVECYGDLALTGSPEWFYIEGGNAVKTYPVGGTLSVRYWKQAAALTADADTLIVPDSWVQLVIDRARYRGLLRIGDWQGAQVLKAEVKDAMEDMVVDLMSQQVSDPAVVEVYDGGDS